MEPTIIAAIITGLITGGVSLAGIMSANSKHQAIVMERIENLTKQVEKHNSIIERTYKLEEQQATHDLEIKHIQKEIDKIAG